MPAPANETRGQRRLNAAGQQERVPGGRNWNWDRIVNILKTFNEQCGKITWTDDDPVCQLAEPKLAVKQNRL
jgi:hypothetical protein